MRSLQSVLARSLFLALSLVEGVALSLPPVASPPAPSAPLEQDAMLGPVAPPPHVVATWDDALATLRARSIDFRIALDEIERSEGLWRQSLAASLPTLTGTGNVTLHLLRDRPCNPAGNCSAVLLPDAVTYGAGITLTQPLFAPRAWHASGTFRINSEVAQLQADDQKRVLTISLADAIVAVVTAERLSEINRIGLRAALERFGLARRRVSLGAGTSVDSVRAEQDVSVARAAIVSGDESLRRARETLGLSLGWTDAWGVSPGINLNGVEASAHASCDAASKVEERADMIAAQRATDVARRNVDDVKLAFVPTVNLVSTFAYQSSSGDVPSTYVSGLHEAWSIAAVLSVPFYEGGARYGALRETRALADESIQRYEAARRTATVQIVQARRNTEVARQSRDVAEQARNLARETERLSRIAFQAGTATSLDLVESGRRLREAEVTLALQEYALIEARISALLSLSRCHW